MAILSFGDRRTTALFQHGSSPEFPAELGKVAKRRLDAIHAAAGLGMLRFPPGNRLERLRGDLAGWYSIRINRQWRIIFQWSEGAEGVQVMDYHD